MECAKGPPQSQSAFTAVAEASLRSLPTRMQSLCGRFALVDDMEHWRRRRDLADIDLHLEI